MTNFIPVFPLNIVVYPGETLNLHIFEPRYKQMVQECIAQGRPFGLPPVVERTVPDLGTLIEITEMAKTYEDESMDIRTKGVSVFRILTPVSEIPDKLYSGAIVNYPDNILDRGDHKLGWQVVEEVKRLYALLNVPEKFPDVTEGSLSYKIGHFVGFSLEQEYELLGLFTELQRLEYIRRHLANIVPVIKELEEMKERIQRNGHFRNLSLE
jgi:Lon protease-like protein